MILGNDFEMNIINDPPHILNENGQMMPSSLIPFCSFGSVLRGKPAPYMSLPVCDLFDTAFYNGKLCYQIDTAKKIPKGKTIQGNGLTLVIDTNIEKSMAKQIEEHEKKSLGGFDLRKVPVQTKRLVGVNIGILAPYQANGPGNYILSSIKQMSATEDFLSMSFEKRQCVKEKFESCQQRLLKGAIRHCGCSPQNLIPLLRDHIKVISFNHHILRLFRRLFAQTMGLIATRITTLLVWLRVKESMLMFRKGDFLKRHCSK